MDPKEFQKLVQNHFKKLSDAWIKLSDKDWKEIGGDLEKFIEQTMAVYELPREVILRELDAVKKNIDEGIETDYVPYLDPIE